MAHGTRIKIIILVKRTDAKHVPKIKTVADISFSQSSRQTEALCGQMSNILCAARERVSVNRCVLFLFLEEFFQHFQCEYHLSAK